MFTTPAALPFRATKQVTALRQPLILLKALYIFSQSKE
jgi:hypothetical protein